MMLPGRIVIVSTIDGDSVQGVTRWSWSWLRLRDVRTDPSVGTPDVAGRVIIPATSILSIQVLPKGDR